MDAADVANWRNQPIPPDSSEKRQYLYTAFVQIVDVAERARVWGASPPFFDAEQTEVYKDWERYRDDPNAPRAIQVCFVEYFDDKRWDMRGTHPDSPERKESVTVLKRNAWVGLANAMKIYEARKPRDSSSPTANHTPLFPSPSQYGIPFENSADQDGARPSSAGSSEGPPGPAPSSATRSQFSMNSGMMFPMDR